MVVTVAVKNVRSGRPCAINWCLFKDTSWKELQACICFSSPDTIPVVFTEGRNSSPSVGFYCSLKSRGRGNISPPPIGYLHSGSVFPIVAAHWRFNELSAHNLHTSPVKGSGLGTKAPLISKLPRWCQCAAEFENNRIVKRTVYYRHRTQTDLLSFGF